MQIWNCYVVTVPPVRIVLWRCWKLTSTHYIMTPHDWPQVIYLRVGTHSLYCYNHFSSEKVKINWADRSKQSKRQNVLYVQSNFSKVKNLWLVSQTYDLEHDYSVTFLGSFADVEAGTAEKWISHVFTSEKCLEVNRKIKIDWCNVLLLKYLKNKNKQTGIFIL